MNPFPLTLIFPSHEEAEGKCHLKEQGKQRERLPMEIYLKHAQVWNFSPPGDLWCYFVVCFSGEVLALFICFFSVDGLKQGFHPWWASVLWVLQFLMILNTSSVFKYKDSLLHMYENRLELTYMKTYREYFLCVSCAQKHLCFCIHAGVWFYVCIYVGERLMLGIFLDWSLFPSISLSDFVREDLS